MTMELFGDSDVESFSETSSDDQDDIFSIYSGHAQSILSSLEDSIEKINDFLSFERGFTYGDIVRSTGNPSGQMGKIVGLKMYVDIENLFGEVIKDVDSGKLLRMRSVLVGDYVIHGSWLGRVEKVVDNVGIVLDDGTKCKIMATDQANLLPISPNLLDDSLYPYHPGQRVKVSHSMTSKPTGWFRGMSKKIQHEGTVSSVEVGLVYIDWISSAMVGNRVILPPPHSVQDPENATLLSYFSHANWQLGDWCIFQSDTTTQRRDLHPNLDEIFSIVKKKIKVDILWQDGNCSFGLESQSLFPVSALNAHDFFPEQYVLEKTNSEDLVTPVNRRWGVVKCVDANEMTVKVKWESSNSVTKDVDEGKMVEETVSAYELAEHPDFSFNIADIVFMSGTDPFAHQPNRKIIEARNTLESKDCDANMCDTQKNLFLSSIGYVVGFENGAIVVEWASGVTTKVAPYKILRMEKDDGSVATHFLQEEHVTELRDTVTVRERQSADHQDLSDKSGIAAEGCQAELRGSSILSISQVAVGLLTGIAANFFKSEGSTSKPNPISCTYTLDAKIGSFNEEDIVSCDKFPDFDMMKISDFDTYKCLDLKANNAVENSVLVAENTVATQFKQFDIVEDCSDHHFLDAGVKGAALSQIRKGWLKKVQQEWNILEKDLPGTIYVRIYEGRMDLLRVAIVGAHGTPYQDGLFFFDLLLPPDYPNVPPLVHYHSGGLRLNPNLYESGRVCLSLLNTWTGTGSEVWNPGSSTILQVLLSLQALVLNERPYFNEAGYDQQIGETEGENNSVSYNENAYLGTCKCMLYQLRRPLKNFEGLVKEHFERRSQHILSACKAYMEGAPIGSSTKRVSDKENSKGFKIMLAKLFPKLVQAFSEKGIDCSLFIEQET